MSLKPEIEQIEAAMKRAAEKALHGTREERSGRFVLDENRDAKTLNDVRTPPANAEGTKPL